MYAKKRRTQLLNSINADAALVLSKSNRFYFSGFESSDGAVLITKDTAYLIVDFRYYYAACNAADGLVPVLSEKSVLSSAAKTAKKHSIKSLAYEEDYVTVSAAELLRETFDKTEFIPSSKKIDALRAVKDQSELLKIKKAQDITDKAFSHILNYINIGISEKEIALETEIFMRKNGAKKAAFDVIALSGENTANPHGVPSDRCVKTGDFVLLDFGAAAEGYCSDMTRTVAVGHATQKMTDIYNIVKKAQEKALSYIKSGKTGADTDACARQYISSFGYGECFGHGLGHGVGIDIHESPRFSPSYKEPVYEGAVVTVEPGIYINSEFGVRIEDIVAVTKQGHVNLTKSTKELIVL